MRNDKPLKTRVLISSIILMFMVLCDIYMIVSIPQNFQLLAVAAFITFLWMTFTLDGWMSLRELASREREEQYQDILKAEKASYLIFQQKFQDLDNKLNFIGQKIMPLEKSNIASQKRIASMLDSLSEEQKKIAKILISRSKENADALINSNGQLMGHMNDLFQSIDNMEGIGAIGQAAGSATDIQSIQNTQKEILANLQEILHLLGSEGLSPNRSVSADDSGLFSNAVQDRQEAAAKAEERKPAPVEGAEPVPAAAGQPEPVKGEEPAPVAAGQLGPAPAAAGQPEPVKGAEPAPVAAEQPEPVSTAAGQPEPVKGTEPISVATGQPEPARTAAEQPVRKAAPPKPNLTDSNQMMSPEDIAALIANAAVEELPDTPPEMKEEKPPKPEISDPNQMMTPEDIAALIANM